MIVNLLIWFSIFWLYYVILNTLLIPNGYTFRYKRYGVSLLSAIFCLFSIFVFDLTSNILSVPYIILIITLLTIYETFFSNLHQKLYRQKNNLRKISPVLGRSMELIFQQIMIFILVKVVFINFDSAIVLSGTAFFVSHLPIFLLKRLPMWWRINVAIISIVAGIVFSFLIYTFPYGFYIAYIVHLTFYFILGIFTGEKDKMLP